MVVSYNYCILFCLVSLVIIGNIGYSLRYTITSKFFIVATSIDAA